MKATLGLLSFLVFFLCTHTFFRAAAEVPDAVRDMDGKKLQAGVKYYILPVLRGFGGGLTLSSLGNKTCPLTVVQARNEVERGSPVTFSPVTHEGVVRVSTDLNIKSFHPYFRICVQSNVWKLNYDKAMGKYFIFNNGVEGNPGPETLSNWFKIEKCRDDYKLVYCPTVCKYCKVICKDVGICYQHGIRRLALTDDGPLVVQFKKAISSV